MLDPFSPTLHQLVLVPQQGSQFTLGDSQGIYQAIVEMLRIGIAFESVGPGLTDSGC